MNVQILSHEENLTSYHLLKDMVEIGKMASWNISSCKSSFGMAHLTDDSHTTFWQSDGFLPHWINIRFPNRICISFVCLLLSHQQDDSYTPHKIVVRLGTSFHDFQEIQVVELEEPNGWVMIPIEEADMTPLETFMVNISVLSNHQGGRDTHIRQIKIFSPKM